MLLQRRHVRRLMPQQEAFGNRYFFTRDAFTTHKRNAVNDIETRLTQLYFTTKRDSKKNRIETGLKITKLN